VIFSFLCASVSLHFFLLLPVLICFEKYPILLLDRYFRNFKEIRYLPFIKPLNAGVKEFCFKIVFHILAPPPTPIWGLVSSGGGGGGGGFGAEGQQLYCS
jgi:hypothetical protein